MTAITEVLAQIKERAGKATPGPWFVEQISGIYVGNKSPQSCGLWQIVHSQELESLKDSARQEAISRHVGARQSHDNPRTPASVEG